MQNAVLTTTPGSRGVWSGRSAAAFASGSTLVRREPVGSSARSRRGTIRSAGGPHSSRKWTALSLERIAAQLSRF
jgi:hypothetical protein